MKTLSVSVERNFHIMNDDRFIMEKISMTAELSEHDNADFELANLRHAIEENFKRAYPKVEDSLNFHVVRDYSNNLSNSNQWTKAPSDFGIHKKVSLPTDAEFEERNDDLKLPTTIPEKINKGTIEEQIQAFEGTQEEFVKTWEYVSNMNPKYKEVYKKRFAELHPLSLYKNINQ